MSKLFFESESQKQADHSCQALLKIDSLSSLFCKDRVMRGNRSRSFLKTDESESLMVALKGGRRVKDRIPNPGFKSFAGCALFMIQSSL